MLKAELVGQAHGHGSALELTRNVAMRSSAVFFDACLASLLVVTNLAAHHAHQWRRSTVAETRSSGARKGFRPAWFPGPGPTQNLGVIYSPATHWAGETGDLFFAAAEAEGLQCAR